jgi:hypothetical protein
VQSEKSQQLLIYGDAFEPFIDINEVRRKGGSTRVIFRSGDRRMLLDSDNMREAMLEVRSQLGWQLEKLGITQGIFKGSAPIVDTINLLQVE